MQVIKLNATDSTNAYLKRLALTRSLDDFTVVTTVSQLKGRGQMGTTWLSEPGKNLILSVLKKFQDLPASEQFRINIGVSLAIYAALYQINVPDLKIKWPNDIMSGNCKICGILIENVLSGQHITASVIGVGLNVNQTAFENLPKVSSLKLLMGNTFNLEELLSILMERFQEYLPRIMGPDFELMKKQYGAQLFRKDKPATFLGEDGELFVGIIKDVSPSGRLMVLLEGGAIHEFDLKQLKLMY